MEISKAQTEATYAMAKRVYAGELKLKEAAEELNRTHGMKSGSAFFGSRWR
jgi:hypothetical protein